MVVDTDQLQNTNIDELVVQQWIAIVPMRQNTNIASTPIDIRLTLVVFLFGVLGPQALSKPTVHHVALPSLDCNATSIEGRMCEAINANGPFRNMLVRVDLHHQQEFSGWRRTNHAAILKILTRSQQRADSAATVLSQPVR